MPLMIPPHDTVRRGGCLVPTNGIEVPEVEVTDLLADGWTLPPIAAPRTITDDLAELVEHGRTLEEPQS